MSSNITFFKNNTATNAIFNNKLGLVTISKKEYEKLLQYKELALEMKAILEDGVDH